jgi:hypothetical protein
MSDAGNEKPKFVFEKNVPIPPAVHKGNTGSSSMYPYQYMDVGDSHLAAGVVDKKDVGKHIAAVSGARTKFKERRYVYRVLPEGFRVWRNNDVASKK